MTLRRLPIALAALAVAACATVPAPRSPGVWRLQSSATTGAALIFEAGGHAVLQLACRRNPADLYVASDQLKATGGPVVLQVGARSFALTARTDEPRLAATAAIPDSLPAALMSGGAIGLSAGRQALPSLPAPDGKVVVAFVISCRAETANG
jgi:hypothetical protein